MAKNSVLTSLDHRALSLVLCGLMLLSSMPLVSAADSDGDGFEDSVDDCPWAYGTSTVDKDGCPDRDGDGTSDGADGWTSNNPNFSEEFHISNLNAYSIDHNADGTLAVAAVDDRVRIYNASTYTTVVSSADLVDGNNAYVTSVDWSPDDMYVAATLTDDTAVVMWASNLTVIHDGITHSGDTRTFSDVAFMTNSTSFAVVDENGGGWGGGNCNGCAVMLVSVEDGQIWREVKPAGNSGSYSSVTFSPDGSVMAVGGDGNAYLIETNNWTTLRALNPGTGENVNGIEFSPDGTMVGLCTQANMNGARLRAFNTATGASMLDKTSTSSCYGVDVSPDNTQVAYAIGYYSTDGGSVLVYEHTTGLLVDRIQLARGNNACSQFGGQNPCGDVNGVSWHPDGYHIVAAVDRNYEGVYFLFADIDPDNDGYNSTDQGDGIVDDFPDDGTQWTDTDGDGYGDNPAPANQPDACISVAGTSTEDRYGCPDADGDGWSDAGDWAPYNPDQWVDADGDGYGDNYLYEVNEYQFHVNQSGDAFPNDATQWNDTDGDGYGDNYENASWTSYRPSEWPGVLLTSANEPDAFPLDRTQYMDTDGDWVGDNPNSDRADLCPNQWGDSQYDRLGCPDADGDGYSDPDAGWPATTDCFGADAFPDDPTQWCDEDNDGYGSNANGNNPDDCPSSAGTSYIDRAGCADRDGDGYSNAGDPFPDDPTQWSDRDGDNRGDNASGNNPDAFPDDTSQWKDTDGDGYGDNPGGNNGDAFPTDSTQWSDEDGDGYGDNAEGTDGDVCPMDYGESQEPLSRGCPDSDLDGVTDPLDAFPNDPFQWADTDGDGYGDNTNVPSGDDCVEEFGKSFEEGRQGCPDADLDGYADVDDAFPTDHEQWVDTDGDGYGDNYFWENITVEDSENPGMFITLREQRGDAFPDIASQWSDIDGDGWGDNTNSSNRVDSFPLRNSQWLDFDGDGFGDNVTGYQPDMCQKVPGTSTSGLEEEWYGCPDADSDGVADDADACPWDPAYSLAADKTKCTITKDPSASGNEENSGTFLSGETNTLVWMGGVIIFMLALIIVAQVSRAAGKRKAVAAKREEMMVQASFAEEEERRQAWIQHYIAEGNYAEARALGWEGTEGLPEWKQYEMQQQAAQEAAIPSMLDLDSP
jgi:hypothetical protein